jgi:hypothetical protein
MWRAFFLALGIYLCILGAECLVIDNFVMAGEQSAAASEANPAPPGPATLFGATAPPLPPARRDIQPADWAPWSLLSAGAVVILYALTINRQG